MHLLCEIYLGASVFRIAAPTVVVRNLNRMEDSSTFTHHSSLGTGVGDLQR